MPVPLAGQKAISPIVPPFLISANLPVDYRKNIPNNFCASDVTIGVIARANRQRAGDRFFPLFEEAR